MNHPDFLFVGTSLDTRDRRKHFNSFGDLKTQKIKALFEKQELYYIVTQDLTYHFRYVFFT